MTNWEPPPLLPYQGLRKKGTVKLEGKCATVVQLLSFLKHWWRCVRVTPLEYPPVILCFVSPLTGGSRAVNVDFGGVVHRDEGCQRCHVWMVTHRYGLQKQLWCYCKKTRRFRREFSEQNQPVVLIYPLLFSFLFFISSSYWSVALGISLLLLVFLPIFFTSLSVQTTY